MANNSPWSVKGVDPEAREAAKIAARRQGVTVGRWLTQTILATAARELKGPGHAQPAAAGQADARAYTRDGASARDDFAHGQGPEGPTGGPPALTPEAVLESIQKLASRIEESEARTADALRPIAEKVGELRSQIDEIKNTSGTSTAPVERAMMRLSERLDRIEDTSSTARPTRTSSAEGGFLSRLFGRD